MKKPVFTAVLPIAFLLFISCGKEQHAVRFKNNYPRSMYNVSAGTAGIGTVNPGETTGYVSIATGNFEVSGTSSTGELLTGSGSLKGKGRHKWTIVLTSAGTISMTED